ncbi:MAG: ubiH [Gammaproteobacteria bacterium]|jgi:2-octaprenyl-6-methoxyphenol hydroxylase|nr:ubiH [Gammaproteobacteria bacterium]
MKFDIVIIGGGMVGATLACALSNSALRIALVDAAPVTSMNDDKRLIALNDSNCHLFDNLGIWTMLAPFGAPIKQVHVSRQGHFGITRIHATELGLDTLGYVVPACDINNILFSDLQKKENLTLLYSATLQQLKQEADTVTVKIETSSGTQEYTADLVIGADGSQSTVRQLLNIPTQKIDYQQSALVTITELAREHHNKAYERFQEQGAIAMLPLKGMRVATIWTAPHEWINHLMQLSDIEFLQQLQQQFGYRLGRFQKINQRATYPLYMQYVEQPKNKNVLLIGNAAHTLHPIAAQGLNSALYEVAVLADYLLSKSSLKNCLEYFSNDDSQQRFSRYLSDSLVKLFSNQSRIPTFLRQTGMIGLDVCSMAKKKFAHLAMGKARHVPRLLVVRARDDGTLYMAQ